ncbi:MAG: glutathione S-transferase family protein [Chromatiaceae bacterium]|nr:glutathione S-transferase family protein [Chromatiaceae bacterium]MCP5313817.1 glutathione S-transferase family protein [Chromatiaceae bacterium]
MELVLYYQPGTRALRVRWVLEELALPYRLERIDLRKGEGNTRAYRAIHPLGQLPALQVDGEVMIESGAIVHWLAETHPEQGLAPPPGTPARRAFDQWMYFAVSTLEDPAWEIILHRDILPERHAVKAIVPFAERRLRQVLDVLESALTGRQYLVEDRFGAADIMVGYILMWFADECATRPALHGYVERLAQRPAYLRARND